MKKRYKNMIKNFWKKILHKLHICHNERCNRGLGMGREAR